MTSLTQEAETIKILGTRVHMIQLPEVVALMDHWVQDEPDKHHHVVNTGMHGIMEAHRNPGIKEILNSAALLAPDGILTILIARIHGYRLKKQETGPDLLWMFSKAADRKGYKYFLYGDTDRTLELLSAKLADNFPNLQVVGRYSPPFRASTAEEDEATVQLINQTAPDVLWVGLGMPKQEQWIYKHRDRLNVPVVVGAGASFKFASGAVARAPVWVGNLGFEWVWRLVSEPRRVWRRVFIDAPQFICLALLELKGNRKFR